MSRLDRINDWVARAQKAKFKLKLVAEDCRVTPGHLRKYFNERFGLSAQGWLGEIRLWEAARLLCDGRSIKETAFAVSFADSAHLCRTFKDYHGCTPSQFIILFESRRRAIAGICEPLNSPNDVDEAEVLPWRTAFWALERKTFTRKLEMHAGSNE